MAELKKSDPIVVDKSVDDGRGPECYMVMEWNRQTMNAFFNNRKPRQGRTYAFKCIRFDGKRAYFTLEQL